MENIKCCSCGETELSSFEINDDNVITCKKCGLSMTASEYIEANGISDLEGDFIKKYRNLLLGDVTMVDVLEILNSNIEFSKKHANSVNKTYDDSDLPF